MQNVKAILIDVDNEEIKEIEIDVENYIGAMYVHMKCDTVEAHNLSKTDFIFLDEEPFVRNKKRGFSLYSGKFIGSAIIVGKNRQGTEIEDTTYSAYVVRQMVRFI